MFEDPQLNDRFIEMVEKIHMKDRMMGVQFSIKSREAKDRYIDANMKMLSLSYLLISNYMEKK
ncbi:MAG TPA: hypothetical protein VFX75_01715 [Nitrososphaeraceae archaeon]|nr:hypothetical protein [Nitrososphaeraceae archaeon]